MKFQTYFILNSQHSQDNPDQLMYSAQIYYMFEQVAVIVFDYKVVRFKIWSYFYDIRESSELWIRYVVYNPIYTTPSINNIFITMNVPPSNCQLIISPNTGEALVTDFNIQINSCQDEQRPLNYMFYIYYSQADYDEERINPINIKRFVIQEFSKKNFITTKLPKGKLNDILILGSVSDSLGSITNLTSLVQVNANQLAANQDITTYASQIDLYLLNSEQLIFGKRVGIRTIATLDIYNEEIDRSSSQIINLRKILLEEFKTAQSEVNQLSSLDFQINNMINQLMTNSSDLLSSIPTSDLNSQLDNMDIFLQSEQQKMREIPLTSRNQFQTRRAEKIDGNYISNVGIINGMFGGTENNTENVTQKDYQNKKMLNLTQSVVQGLTQNSLANEAPKTIDGDSLIVQAQVITDKGLQKYLRSIKPNLDNIALNDETDQSQNQSAMKVAFQNYKTNPYSQDPNFPDPTSPNRIVNPDIRQEGSEEKMNLSQPINHVFAPSQLGNRQRIMQDEQSSPIPGCAALEPDTGSWTANTCETVQNEDESGELYFECVCKTLDTATLLADASSVFQVLSNLFGAAGLSAFANFEFWFSIIFYIFLIKTGVWIYGIRVGYLADKDNIRIQTDAMLAEQANEANGLNQIVNDENQQDKELYITDFQQEAIKIEKTHQSPQHQIESDTKFVLQEDNMTSQVQNQKDQKQDKKEKKQKSEEEKEKEELLKKPLNPNRQLLLGIFRLHEITSIQYTYDKKLSRPTRCTLYYFKIVIVLCFSAIFSNQFSLIQGIIISVVVSAATAIPLALIKIFLSKKILMPVGVLIVLGCFGLCFYMIMVNAALMGLDKSNEWTFQYTSSWITDTFCIQAVSALIKLKLFQLLIPIDHAIATIIRKQLSSDQPLLTFFHD